MNILKSFISIFILFTLAGCIECDDDLTYNATVLGPDINCSEFYLIQFGYLADGVPDNITNNTFLAINLPEEYKVRNLNVEVLFRLPAEFEYLNCTTQGFNYPEIYIEEVLYLDWEQ